MTPVYGTPETLEEQIVFWSIVGTWCLYLLGALYFVMPFIGWTLATIALGRRLQDWAGDEPEFQNALPAGSLVWIGGMVLMGIALLVGHIEHDALQLIKSILGWMKGWALIAVFVFVGAAMSIRAEIVYRASNLLAIQTLLLAPVLLFAGLFWLPNLEYVSPLSILGGSGAEYFTVHLYGLDSGKVRWSFYAPWAPAAALIGSMSLVFAYFDKSPMRRGAGILAALTICAMSQSRLSYVAVPLVGVLILGLSNLSRPPVYIIAAAACFAALPFDEFVLEFIENAQDQFNSARAASSRVRATLQSIALHRWWTEAPIWGHGTVEPGPWIVANMMIGTHHTWNGLLFVKGLVGFVALAVPMAWSMIEVTAKAQRDRVARSALGVLLVLALYSFGENLESLIYLFWPGMVVVGIALRRRFVNPFTPCLGLDPA